MSKRLFCGGLAWATTTEDLEEAFAAFGEVTDAKVVSDRETGRSRGFGFVTYTTEEAAASTNIEDSLDYAALAVAVKTLTQDAECLLVETLASLIADLVLSYPLAQAVQVDVLLYQGTQVESYRVVFNPPAL